MSASPRVLVVGEAAPRAVLGMRMTPCVLHGARRRRRARCSDGGRRSCARRSEGRAVMLRALLSRACRPDHASRLAPLLGTRAGSLVLLHVERRRAAAET